MSISTSSWESLFDLTARFYNPNLPTYFVDDHLDIVCNAIGLLSNCSEYRLVVTNVILHEPIVQYDKVIYLCRPLIALLVNKPVDLPPNRVEFLQNFNIFDSLRNIIEKSRGSKQIRQSSSSSRRSNNDFDDEDTDDGNNNNKSVSIYIDSDDDDDDDDSNDNDNEIIASNDNSVQLFGCTISPDNFQTKYSIEINVRVQQTLRLMIAVVHYMQHVKSKSPFTCHTKFQNFEIAKIKYPSPLSSKVSKSCNTNRYNNFSFQ